MAWEEVPHQSRMRPIKFGGARNKNSICELLGVTATIEIPMLKQPKGADAHFNTASRTALRIYSIAINVDTCICIVVDISVDIHVDSNVDANVYVGVRKRQGKMQKRKGHGKGKDEQEGKEKERQTPCTSTTR